MISSLNQRHQKATRWVPGASSDGFSPATWTRSYLNVRWEQRSEVFIDNTGSEVQSRAVVYVAIDLNVGDFLALGLSTASSPVALSSAYEVKDFRRLPSLQAKFYERRAML